VNDEQIGPDLGENKCTETKYFWEEKPPERRQTCLNGGAYKCDVSLHPNPNRPGEDFFVCTLCHDKQVVAVKNPEKKYCELDIVQCTKRHLCPECQEWLMQERMKPNGFRPALERCYCVGQLQSTYICNEHRQSASRDICNKLDELSESVPDFYRVPIICGKCGKNPMDANGKAWKCIACRVIATLP
jgi:hypothetical protein